MIDRAKKKKTIKNMNLQWRRDPWWLWDFKCGLREKELQVWCDYFYGCTIWPKI